MVRPSECPILHLSTLFSAQEAAPGLGVEQLPLSKTAFLPRWASGPPSSHPSIHLVPTYLLHLGPHTKVDVDSWEHPSQEGQTATQTLLATALSAHEMDRCGLYAASRGAQCGHGCQLNYLLHVCSPSRSCFWFRDCHLSWMWPARTNSTPGMWKVKEQAVGHGATFGGGGGPA